MRQAAWIIKEMHAVVWTEYTGIWSKIMQMANQTRKHPLYLADPGAQ